MTTDPSSIPELAAALDARDRQALRYCTYCPRLCRFACPVAHGEARETVTPWGLMRLLNLLHEGHLAPDEELLEVLHHCISCGRCQSFCRHDNPVAEVLAKGRAALVARGVGLPVDGPETCPGGVTWSTRQTAHAGAPVLAASCAHAQSEAAARRLGQALDALEQLGLPVALAARGPDTDCGFHLWETGRPRRGIEAWRAFVDIVAAAFPATPPGPLRLTDCAPALWAFAEQTPPPPWGPRHLIAWLADQRERLPAKALAGSGPYAVHDSCFTSRRLGLGPALRQVVAHLSGEPPRELFEHHDSARCCGAEGGWAQVETEAQGRAADTVLADIIDSGARWVVTGSTTCRNSLRERIQRHEREEGGAVEVLDPFDLLILTARAVDQLGGST